MDTKVGSDLSSLRRILAKLRAQLGDKRIPEGPASASLAIMSDGDQARVRSMLDDLRLLVEIESPSGDTAALQTSADAVSAIHNSIPVSFVWRNASFDPSGENFTFDTRACGGIATFVSAPPAIFFNVIS